MSRFFGQIRRASRAGYTLVELMVTLVVASIALIAIYAMLASTSATLHYSELTAENQNNVRFVGEFLKLDLMRAGLNSTPFAQRDVRVCPKPTFNIQALSSRRETLSATAAGLGEEIVYDDVIIVGDPTGLPPFRVREFVSPREVVLDAGAEEYATLFVSPNLLRVENPDGFMQFAVISGSAPLTGGGLSVELSTSLVESSGGSTCGYQPLSPEMHVGNVVSAVRYVIEADADVDGKTNLHRYDYSLPSERNEGVPLLVAEFAVGLNLFPVGPSSSNPMETAITKESDNDLFALDPSTSTSDIDLTTEPQRARFMIFRVLTRTQRAIPRRVAVPDDALSATAASKLYFKISDTQVAGVRTLQSRIEAPNLTLRNLR